MTAYKPQCQSTPHRMMVPVGRFPPTSWRSLWKKFETEKQGSWDGRILAADSDGFRWMAGIFDMAQLRNRPIEIFLSQDIDTCFYVYII